MTYRSGKWLVTKYDGLQKMWERELPANKFTPIQIRNALERLVCTDLTSEEVINSLDPRSDVSLLNVRSDANGGYTAGENPHYTARHID